MSRIDVHLGASFIYIDDLPDIFNLQLRINALGEHVISHIQYIYVSGTLAVSEQGSFHTVCACQQGQLCCRHAGSTVIMRVDT